MLLVVSYVFMVGGIGGFYRYCLFRQYFFQDNNRIGGNSI
jgi:hypothetical protein